MRDAVPSAICVTDCRWHSAKESSIQEVLFKSRTDMPPGQFNAAVVRLGYIKLSVKQFLQHLRLKVSAKLSFGQKYYLGTPGHARQQKNSPTPQKGTASYG